MNIMNNNFIFDDFAADYLLKATASAGMGAGVGALVALVASRPIAATASYL